MLASPGTASKASPTTTTTTKPGKNAAFAKLAIKASSVGHVSVEAAGTSTFKPGKDGQSLHVGDTVKTDATGQAEIDYADSAYTRLDVNTTFTIKKLSDSQGNRQVEGSLDIGRTYNRTAALTQSQTFQQDAGGATAAVAGTAFVVTCTSATTCTFTAVIDNINLSGAGGQTKTLNPLDECIDNSGALCGTTTRLTPDELALIQWIQTNVLADLTEHGIGDGVFQPFAATVVVNGAVVQSVSAAPSSTTPGSPPPPPPPPPLPPTVDQAHPVCTPPGGTCTPQSSLAVTTDADTNPNSLGGGDSVNFQLSGGTDPNNPSGLQYQFTTLPSFGTILFGSTPAPVVAMQPYAPSTSFQYATNETSVPVGGSGSVNGEVHQSDSFKYQAVDTTTHLTSTTATVNVTTNGEP